MKINKNYILIFILLFILPKAKSAEIIFLYKGTFSRSLRIEELHKFKESKIPGKKLKRLLKITNQNEQDFHNFLTYEIELPLKTSSKLMNSTIGEVFLTRITKIIHPNKILNKDLGIKALRSGIILSSYKNNQKVNFLNFLKSYPNKSIAINLNALSKTLKKVESLKELIEFYSNSPFKKLKDGSSSN